MNTRIFHRRMAECRKIWMPLLSSVRCMSLGHHYRVSKKKCFYTPSEGNEEGNKIRIPFGERVENMSRERRWQRAVVEDVFEKYNNIIAFHMNYIPRQHYE